ncbi:MAG: APC family permease [Candidatus Riflebacteria bacterium]|nr:APC family permease [Candidatus Riflebacteria bacterium]
MPTKTSFLNNFKRIVIGDARDPHDKDVFHDISLIAFLAWVGLGADGISSSCYGPEEAFRALSGHSSLSIFVGLASAITVFVIASSYSQIIELFPSGGGGYLVASKLLSPNLGMVSGCALLVDYVLTITLSIASGADALFSFFGPAWQPLKFWFAVFGLILLTLMNMRGVKESVIPLVPIFLVFIVSHAAIIIYALSSHFMEFSVIKTRVMTDIHQTHTELGWLGMFWILMKAYSMSAGTYTGIEAVSNGLPILREPRVETGKRTMTYMAVSLASIVLGLMTAYLLFDVHPDPDKTLNAVLFEKALGGFGPLGTGIIFITLISEATLLFVAAQAGFLDGPRVLANMAQDRWFPTRFSMLSDRLVTQNGILLMGFASGLLMFYTHGVVSFLVVLYSINVFLTFTLSQLGMVKHWWNVRAETPNWKKKALINGIGLLMTLFILISVTIIKFFEGGWLTIVITGSLVAIALRIKSHYNRAYGLLQKFQSLVDVTQIEKLHPKEIDVAGQGFTCDLRSRTAVFLVNGFNGQGVHTLLQVIKMFDNSFRNYIFLHVGMIDAGNFKGVSEVQGLEQHSREAVQKYVNFMNKQGYYAEGVSAIAVDVVEETMTLANRIRERFTNTTFFSGQLVFPEDSFVNQLLHNNIASAVQRNFFLEGIPFILMPVIV